MTTSLTTADAAERVASQDGGDWTHTEDSVGREQYLARVSAAVDALPVAAVLVDPHAHDNPMTHVNEAFVELTGYAREDVLGRNCRMLQGEATDPLAVSEIRDAIAHEQPIGIDLVNHRADGSTFINSLVITPLRHAGQIVAYLGVQSTA